MKIAYLCGIALASLIPAAATQEPAFIAPASSCEDLISHEPIVHFEVNGYTLAGQTDRTLTVFADGSMKLSAASDTGTGMCIARQTTPVRAQELRESLRRGGALALCDDPRNVTDVPLRTLTLLVNDDAERAHTFNYWLGDEDYAIVDTLLENFILEQFPRF